MGFCCRTKWVSLNMDTMPDMWKYFDKERNVLASAALINEMVVPMDKLGKGYV